jgi:hypothetical protein
MIVLGFAAAMFIAPQCRAQFEIDPDHFDGTDSWQAAALAKVHVRKTNRASAGAGGQALHGNTSGRATLRQAKPSADYTAPLEVRREFFNGIHVAKDDPKFQMEAQHYCRRLKSGMFQCVLFDSTGADAKLMGIEYIISDAVYKTLPDGEKKFWHPHPFEVLGGGLIAPDMSPDKEQKFMGTIMNTWGKTFHTWGDPMAQIPLGEPRLMWAVTGPGQVDQKLLRERDKTFNVNTEEISARRQKNLVMSCPTSHRQNRWILSDVAGRMKAPTRQRRLNRSNKIRGDKPIAAGFRACWPERGAAHVDEPNYAISTFHCERGKNRKRPCTKTTKEKIFAYYLSAAAISFGVRRTSASGWIGTKLEVAGN